MTTGTTTVEAEGGSAPRTAAASGEASKASTRGGLVLPVILIISISLLTTLGLVLASAYALNTGAQATLRHLASSMMRIQSQKLSNVTREYSARMTDHAEAIARGDLSSAEQYLGTYLSGTYGISVAIVASMDGALLARFDDGRLQERTTPRQLPRGVSVLIESLSANTANRSRVAGDWVLIGDELHLAAAHRIELPPGQEAGGRPEGLGYLVLTQALKGSMLDSLGDDFGLADLDILTTAPPWDFHSLTLRNSAGIPLGYLVWRNVRPGDHILWRLTPTLSLALLAMAYTLYQFFRSTDLILERQSYLMTSLRRERELRDLKTRFVSMVSHELRTPLSTIRSAADLLERYDDRMDQEDRKRELGAIRQAVLRLTRMMENVMLMGRTDTAKVEQKASRIDLDAFCRDLWEETARAMNAKHGLTLRGTAANRIVVTDEVYLRAVLSNLLQNAIKYSPNCTEVAVDIDAEGDDCSIRVTDFGPGIPAEEIDDIFEAFQRGKSVAKTINGTGLGLAVARSSAERLGGTLTVESEVGAGTTFEMQLPGLFAARPPKSKRKSHDQDTRD